MSVTVAVEQAKQVNPFKGPFPLETGDPIFGRDREIDVLLAQLVAHRLVLLHSVSGGGKSSLIEAGLRPRLAEYRLHALPTIRIPRRRDAGQRPLLEPLLQVLKDAEPEPGERGGQTDPAAPRERKRQVFDLLIFDQFEEVLDGSNVSDKERLEFFKYVGGLLKDRSRWALFAMREDYLGALEPYLRYLPTYLTSRFRLTQLSIDGAKDAILKLTDASGIKFQRAAAHRLSQELATSRDADSASDADRGDRFVEPVYLQVVGRYIWDKCRESERDLVTTEDVEATIADHGIAGGRNLTPVEVALQRYYDSAVAAATLDKIADTTAAVHIVAATEADAGEIAAAGPGISELQQRVRRWFNEELIACTPNGEQRRQTLVSSSSPIDVDTLKGLENNYIIRKDVRNGTWYELAHDRLVQPVLRSNLVVHRWTRQPWQESAEAWIQEDEDRAFLTLRGEALAEAVRWARDNPTRVSSLEQKFLNQCAAEARLRSKIKRYRRMAIAATVIAGIAIGGLLVMSGSRLASARAAALQNEELARVRLEEAHKSYEETKKQELYAQEHRLRAEAAWALLKSRQAELGRSEERARGAETRARVASLTADRALAQAADATDAAAQAALERSVALDYIRQSTVTVNAAKAEVLTLSSITQAYDLLANAQRASALEAAISAVRKLADSAPSDWTNQRRQALAESLATIDRLYSRGLLLETLRTESPVLGVALDKTTGCLHYMGENGLYSRGLQDASACQPLAAASLSAASGAAAATKERPPMAATAHAIAPNASAAATGSAIGQIQVARSADQSARPAYKGHRHEVTTAYLSSTGRYLATATSLWAFAVADLQQWPHSKNRPKLLYQYPGDGPLGWLRYIQIYRGETTHTINAFAIDEEGESIERHGPIVATARQDGAVEFFDIAKKKRLLKIRGPAEREPADSGHFRAPTALAFDSTGSRLASGGADAVYVWDLPATVNGWQELDQHNATPHAVALRGCKDPLVAEASDGGVTALAFSPDDRMLAVGCETGVIGLYHLPDAPASEMLRPIESLLVRVGRPTAIVFDRASRRLVVGGSAARLEVWHVPTEAVMRERQQLQKAIAASHAWAARTNAEIDPEMLALTLQAIEPATLAADSSWQAPRPRAPAQ